MNKLDENTGQLTYKGRVGELRLRFDEDGTASDMVNLFRTIMTFMTYLPQTIDSIFIDDEKPTSQDIIDELKDAIDFSENSVDKPHNKSTRDSILAVAQLIKNYDVSKGESTW